ncbi:MAG: RsmF rRNA methyltransferase first C-terminal domain-containing protein [Clostridiales bacterium]|nr:RsmF rRNA methyltransferase first C-terminal domain-containing protein [Clostridiales bacterium]
MISLPENFLNRIKEILDEQEFLLFLNSYEKESLRGIRYNLLKAEGSGQARNDGFQRVPWCKTGFVYSNDERPAKSIEYHAGLFYIQEPSAMCPAEVLGAEPGMHVLDLCAAPGGKSVQIAGHLQGKGLLVSNDASATRSRALVKNLERAGVTNAVVLTEQPRRIAERFPAFFDRILVDAPCSGEGMFRRDADSLKAYTANKPEACAAMQAEILRYAARMLKPGGRIVYSTCTFNTIENEETIKNFMKIHPFFKIIEIDHAALGVAPGLCDLPQTARIWPHLHAGEGHFIAMLEKDVGGNWRKESLAAETPPPKEFKKFCDEFLDMDLQGHFDKHGINLYLQSVPMDLRGLRVARSGLNLGECKNERFVPGHALAMGLRKEHTRYSVELSSEDADKYLRGESLFCEKEFSHIKPWILICHENLPLGWARLVDGRLKNNLPVGWAIN